MSRLVVRLAYAILFLTLLASVVALTKARFNDALDERPYLFSLPDLSSPRATLETLIANGDTAAREVLTKGVPWQAGPSIRRMMDTVNVNDVAPASRELEAALAAAQLKDVLQHLELPPLSEIPDAAAVKQQEITEWHVPGTPIAIAKVTAGPRTGEFLFSPQTVSLAGRLYDALRATPYRNGDRPNVYEQWRYMPGPLLPRTAIAALPAPLRAAFLGQAIWQWIGLTLLLAVNAIVALHIIGWSIRHDAKETSVYRRYAQPAAALIVTALSFITLALTEYGLKIWGGILEALLFSLQLLAIGGIAWFIVATILRTGELIVRVNDLHDTSLNGQLIRVVSTLLSIAAGVIACFFAADFVGIPVGPLLAGLGIGGLAVALAVRPTLENVIGGLTLFADRPARVGEDCRFGAESGTVEAIGLRTTKIRRSDDTVVTISNSELAQIRIENFSRRRKFQFNPTLRLRYETTAEQLQAIAAGIGALLEQHQKVLAESHRVCLIGFGEYAFEIDVRAYIDVTKGSEFSVVREELNFGILDIVKSAGTAFAIPARTNYLARDAVAVPVPAPTKAETVEPA